MARAELERWQNKTISARSDFRGPLILGLVVAWAWFLFQLLHLPGFVDTLRSLSPLAAGVVDKGRYLPDFGLIIAGAAAFHFQRGLRQEWDSRVALHLYLRLLAPLAAYSLISILLFLAAASFGPHHGLRPWSAPLYAPVFWIMATLLVALILMPSLLYFTWTSIPDVCWAGIAICFAFFGLSFHSGFHHHLALWPLIALFDFVFGVFLCAALFRAVEYLAAVRGATILLGWFALLGGSILQGPALCFVGFTMILAGMVIGERGWYLLGERGLLAWSRTALGLALLQPAVFTAWLAAGMPHLGGRVLTGLALAVGTQLLASLLYVAVMPGARRLLAAPAT